MQLLKERLVHFKSRGLERTLQFAKGHDLCSNDYLGFAKDPLLRRNFYQRLKNQPVSTGASRLLSGHSELYEETERLLANYVNRESALFFSSGYAANLGLLSAILTPEDKVFSDELNHASIIDGIRLSKAEKFIFPHLQYAILEQQLQQHKHNNSLKIIVTESVFSMEGSKANLIKLAALAERYQALLVVDEAHSTGIWGNSLINSLGLTRQVFATTHTAGKALGAAGGWIAGDYLLKDYLIHFARSFIFSTAPLPAMLLLLQEAIAFYQQVGETRAQTIRKRAKFMRALLKQVDDENDTPIIAIPLGDNDRAVAMSRLLQEKSWNVRAIRPPTVPEGKARLRITIKWCNTETMLQEFAHTFLKLS